MSLLKYRFEVLSSVNDEWRWHLLAPNGNSIAASGEGYKNKEDCLDAIQLVKDKAPDAPVRQTE